MTGAGNLIGSRIGSQVSGDKFPEPHFDIRLLDELGVKISSLATDSRRVKPGDTFIACPGEKTDGRKFIPQAIAAGANAVLWESRSFAWDTAWQVPNLPLAGLRAAVRHEAAFRQELALAVPMLLLVPWLAPGRWQAVCMAGSVVLVLVVELLNSAIEALADAITVERHTLLGRAKDLGSAAVMLSLIFAVAVWAIALWP